MVRSSTQSRSPNKMLFCLSVGLGWHVRLFVKTLKQHLTDSAPASGTLQSQTRRSRSEQRHVIFEPVIHCSWHPHIPVSTQMELIELQYTFPSLMLETKLWLHLWAALYVWQHIHVWATVIQEKDPRTVLFERFAPIGQFSTCLIFWMCSRNEETKFKVLFWEMLQRLLFHFIFLEHSYRNRP